MYSTIIAPLDGSPFSESALPVAAAIAARLDAAIHVVAVHTPATIDSLLQAGEPVAAEQRLRARRYLTDRATELHESHGVMAESRMLDGPVAETLRDYAAGRAGALIVMATHGRGGFKRVWLGSVADRLIRLSHTPVLLLRPRQAGRSDIGTFERALIPMDGSGFSRAVLEPAAALVGPDAELELFRAVAPAYVIGSPYMPHSVRTDETEDRRRKDAARADLESVAASVEDAVRAVRTRIVLEADAATAIMEQARRLDVDLIALTTHGRGGVVRPILGSIADKVIRSAEVPVLVVHPDEG